MYFYVNIDVIGRNFSFLFKTRYTVVHIYAHQRNNYNIINTIIIEDFVLYALH